jgi:hypothetical protein
MQEEFVARFESRTRNAIINCFLNFSSLFLLWQMGLDAMGCTFYMAMEVFKFNLI